MVQLKKATWLKVSVTFYVFKSLPDKHFMTIFPCIVNLNTVTKMLLRKYGLYTQFQNRHTFKPHLFS